MIVTYARPWYFLACGCNLAGTEGGSKACSLDGDTATCNCKEGFKEPKCQGCKTGYKLSQNSQSCGEYRLPEADKSCDIYRLCYFALT